MIYACEMVPTGKSLFILILYAEASLTKGFRYIKELLMQHHNFYLNSSYKLLTESGVDVYTGAHSLEDRVNWRPLKGCSTGRAA